MSETAELFLIVFLIYLTECGAWIRRTSLGLRRHARRTRIAHPAMLLGNTDAGLLVSNPVPGWGSLLVAQQWPVAMSPDGVVAGFPLVIDPAHAPLPPRGLVGCDELSRLHVDGQKLLVGSRELAHADSILGARRLRRLLASIGQAPEAERADVIRRALAESADPDHVARRVTAFETSTVRVTLAAASLFVFVFVVAPWLSATHGLVNVWVGLVAGFGLLWSATVASFATAHKHLFPEETRDRWQRVGMLTLMPLSAMRARDVLARRVLDGLDPLIATARLCGEVARPTIQAALRDLVSPLIPPARVADPRAQAAVDWFRAAYIESVTPHLARLGFTVEQATRPPEPQPGAVAYCPRCLVQFLDIRATCDACGERETQAFSGSR